MKLKDMTQNDIMALLNDVVPGTHSLSRIVVRVPNLEPCSHSATRELCTITYVGDDCFPELEKYSEEDEGKYKVHHFWENRPGYGAGGVQYCKTRKELIQHVRDLQESYKMFEAQNQKYAAEIYAMDQAAAELLRNAECSQS